MASGVMQGKHTGDLTLYVSADIHEDLCVDNLLARSFGLTYLEWSGKYLWTGPLSQFESVPVP